MILADTSVWVEFLRQRRPIAKPVEQELERMNIVTIDLVFGELFQGVQSKIEFQALEDYWKWLPKLSYPDLLKEAGKYSYHHDLIHQGVGLIDAALLLACEYSQSKLWTLDKKLLKTAAKDFLYGAS